MSWTFSAVTWRWQAATQGEGWVFVSLPTDVADEIDAAVGPHTGGFGSVRVRVRIGTTTWSTSVFPDRARGTFVLPLKKAVRQAEDVGEGDTVEIVLEAQRLEQT